MLYLTGERHRPAGKTKLNNKTAVEGSNSKHKATRRWIIKHDGQSHLVEDPHIFLKSLEALYAHNMRVAKTAPLISILLNAAHVAWKKIGFSLTKTENFLGFFPATHLRRDGAFITLTRSECTPARARAPSRHRKSYLAVTPAGHQGCRLRPGGRCLCLRTFSPARGEFAVVPLSLKSARG